LSPIHPQPEGNQLIPVKDSLVDVDTLPGEEIEFGIGDPRWVMKTQADLYSDITTAVIREYSTNAHDAHVMAGNPDPIQVTLPTMWNNNFFVVEDKGVGMDIELFRKIYTQFGVSPKRTDANTNGMLGYGSKSGVAYTTQFSVTSIKDGVKIHGVVMRKPDWRIVLKVVSKVKTDEPNGTRIEIPVHNPDEFNQKAKDFYKFWLPGRVLVDGVEPEHHVGEKITEGLYYSLGWNASYVVMGNVAYRINNPDALFRNTKMSRINFVAYADTVMQNGSAVAAVEFTPAREDLKYTDHTKATLQKIIHNFEDQIVAQAKADIDAATTHNEAFMAWSKWTKTLGRSMFADLEFKGDKFKPEFVLRGSRYYSGSSYGYATQTIREWAVDQMPKTLVITEFDINLSSRHKALVKQYAELNNLPVHYFIFTASAADDIECPWIERDNFITWEDLKAAVPKEVRERKVSTRPARIKGTFDFITRDGMQKERELPEKTNNLFWVALYDAKRYSVKRILDELNSDATVVILPANRVNKFTRENPKVENFITHFRSKVVTDASTLLSDDAKLVMGVQYETRRWVNALDVSRLDDP